MGSFGSLATVLSGLNAAQTGLSVTGHNVSNTTTVGYTRQRVEQQEYYQRYVGVNGKNVMTVGLGTDVSGIRQIRDIFLDKAYRNEASRFNFYDVRSEACEEIATIFGELQGSGRISESMDNLWKSLQELSQHPSGIEARSLFLSNAAKFVDKVDNIYNDLVKYQTLLNGQIIEKVTEINHIAAKIGGLSEQICVVESSGDSANDLRDQRNNLLDQLSAFARIDYYEDHNKTMYVQIEGNDYIVGSFVNNIGLKAVSEDYPFVIPVYTSSKDVLPPDDTVAREVFQDLNKTVSAVRGNDYGELKSLLIARGKEPANYTSNQKETDLYIIPKIMREFDVLVNKIVTLVNDTFAPKNVTDPPSPSDLNGDAGLEVFKRKRMERYDEMGNFIEEDPDDLNSLYSFGRIEINAELQNDWNRLATSVTGDIDDNTLIEDILQKWSNTSWIDDDTNAVVNNEYAPRVNQYNDPLSFTAYFTEVMTRLGQIGGEANTFIESESILMQKIMNDRLSVSGVSLDEEMASMMKYQHAYNAASRMVNVLDSMLDKVINGLLR